MQSASFQDVSTGALAPLPDTKPNELPPVVCGRPECVGGSGVCVCAWEMDTLWSSLQELQTKASYVYRVTSINTTTC